MTDLADIDALAADFVLGTLNAADRAIVAQRRAREPGLDAAINAWESRLAPLALAAAPVAAPSDLFAKIERRLDAAATAATNLVAFASANAGALDLQRRLRRWRATALAASAIAASLVVTLGLREYSRQSLEQNYVAVFQSGDASPAFVLSVDVATKTLSIRRVAADVPDGKTYQLWIVAAPFGPAPHSLGLIEGEQTKVHDAIAAVAPANVATALFGVSLEPAGGSPTGKPTGPVFHARLIPTSL